MALIVLAFLQITETARIACSAKLKLLPCSQTALMQSAVMLLR